MLNSYIEEVKPLPADTHCPECGRNFKHFERMSDGNCEICDAEKAAALEMMAEWDISPGYITAVYDT